MLQRRTDWKKQILSVALAVWMLLCAIPQPILAAVGDALAEGTALSLQAMSSGNGYSAEDTYAEKLANLRYDDHIDMTGKTVEVIDAGTPTSYQVGYGIGENAIRDTAVVTLEGETLVATGIGNAKVRIDGTVCEISVAAAPISLILLTGQSNMRGSEGNANQSIVCPDGMVYATYGDDRGADNTAMTVNNATMFVPSALTGEYCNINVEGTTDCLSGYPIYSLTEAGAGKIGPDSGFAYEWVKQTGEKVWIVNAAHGGTSINVWQDGKTEFEECERLFKACQETLRKEIAAGHFVLSHMAYFWCQGCSDRGQSAEWYVKRYLAMHNSFKDMLTFDHDSDPATADKTFEFGGIIPVRVGSTAACYRDGVYTVSNPYAYHESFVDLRFSGPRVAQHWMINNPDLPDIWGVCNIGDDWVWMPDGTNGVSAYFNTHYPGGTVDYTTQVQQSNSWYTPTTPKAVHDSIHYNQIGYNEIGRESVRNALILLGETEAPAVEPTVKLLTWDGYTEAAQVPASTTGNSATLIVPAVSPIWKSKDVTYELSEGLRWNYYDLLADTAETEGVLTAIGAQGSVHVAKGTPGKHFSEHLSQLPENVCCDLNLWSVLEHDKYYYASGTYWGIHSSGDVPSVTIPVNPGDRIFATSFGKAGENGHATSNGIRMTFFSAYGIAKTMAPAETYAEFAANGGYLIAPEGAVAINIPMWNNSDDNEIYILSLDHTYQNGVCTVCGAKTIEYIGTTEGTYINSNMKNAAPDSATPSYCIDKYRVTPECRIQIVARIGEAAYCAWVDADGNRSNALRGNSNSGVNVSRILTVPNGAVYLEVSYSVKYEHYIGEPRSDENYGAQIGLLGDSIAANGGFLHTIQNKLCRSSGKNVAIGGWFYSEDVGVNAEYPGDATRGIYRQIQNLTGDENLIILWAGTNDFGHSHKIGTMLDDQGKPNLDVTTFYGGMHRAIRDLRSKFGEDIPIILCTPLHRNMPDQGTAGYPYSSASANKLGYYLGDYIDAMAAIAAYYDLLMFDSNAETKLDPNNQSINAKYFSDGLHPNAAGHAVIGDALAQFIVNTLSDELGYDYTVTVTAPTCTQQGYTTHTCECGDRYVDTYVPATGHRYENGTCASCGKDMLRIEKSDLVQYQGGVNSLNGTLNTTFTNNWYSDIRIPKGAQQVRYLTFKTGGDWGVAFLQEGTYLSGACDKTVGGQWVTADVPADATVFRYGYLYDAIAAQKGLPAFAYVEFIGDELEQWEQSNYLPRPATGCHSFSVEVNIAPAQGNPDGYVKGTDYGYIQLPTNYSPYGAPTRLIIVCHGAGASLSTYKSSAWKNTNYSFWTDLGYAVMDMYASPQELTGSDSCLHYGNPVVLECYKKGYDYVMQHFNLKQDGIFLIGSSMGGLSSFQIAQSGQFPVIAQVAYCPVIDLFKQAYCNPWTTASYQRSRIASYFGFAGTAPAFTNNRYPSAQEIEFFRQNADKVTAYSPILRNVTDGDITALFNIIPTSPTATSAEEAALYAGLTATHPNPLLVFHNTDDGTVSYRYSQYFVEMVNRSGQEAILRTFTSGNHNAWANGENKTVQGINGTITIKESQYEAYLFFDKFEQHESHCPWTDPAKLPTCNASGLTEGSHCAVCGEVLKKQEPVPAKGHSFTRYISDGNATFYADGTKTALCDHGCGAKDTVADVGSMLLPEQVTSQIYPIAGEFLTGAPAGTTVQTLLSGLDWGKYCTVFDADGRAVAADAAVGTGMVLKLQPKGQIKQTLVIVVAGDLSGDGAVTEADLMRMQSHLLQVQLLTGAFAKAADCSGDGIVSVTDIIRLQALLLR